MDEDDEDMYDRLEDMICDIGESSYTKAHIYDTLCIYEDVPLYKRCTSFTRLFALLKLFNLKENEDNNLSDRCFEAIKILCPMGLEYVKIHACPNDCILYMKKYENLDKCPKYGESHYKMKNNNGDDNNIVSKKRPSSKVLWYLPIISSLKRLFANTNGAKNVKWRADKRKYDGNIFQVAYSLQWKKTDSLFPNFGLEPRNLRVWLSIGGINPFGVGVGVDDVYSGEKFKMCAMLFCTINDFTAYGNLTGYSVKGHKACPICEYDTCFHQFEFRKNTFFLGHQKFLKPYNSYRRLQEALNREHEFESAHKPLTGDEVYQQKEHLNVDFGKTEDGPVERDIWKNRLVFFDLSYWSKLDVRHCLNVMHVEKNVCDSLIVTLINIQDKTKDNKNSHLVMVKMGIRQQLTSEDREKRSYLSLACHTLSKKEKKSFCECFPGTKVPEVYSSNIKKLVPMKDLKLIGLKFYDCHVLMQQLLPVAIHGILPKNVRVTITRLCLFFNAICSKVLDFKKLDDLEEETAIILCQLEIYFPLSFFDIMVHLLVHLVSEIRFYGLIYLRWMYPIEQYMKILKGCTKNHHRPEASIIERYTTKEALEFCSDYLSETESIGIPKSHHDDRF
ncbi:uncharacterized protein LOC127121730 [Lathyrus oleraceus]|uniref:uncharacterized protein LOC127121730 n=1 Tax=Pisum sativum TaxID=3888 RepID=UPI0021D302CA|nr:uncharacterized protein LOC127121730 [Pisum sativum]